MAKGKLAFKNYFRYLSVCCCTFLLLFLVSQLLKWILAIGDALPKKSRAEEDDAVTAFLLQQGALFAHLNSENQEPIFEWVLAVVYTNGIVFLVATILLEKLCQQPEVDEKVSRAIWVHGLPVRDQRILAVSEPFRLSSAALKEVEIELGAHFNEKAHSQRKKAGTRQDPEAAEEPGHWVVDDREGHLPHHSEQEPSADLSVGNMIGARGIFKDKDGRAVFVRKVHAASLVQKTWVVPATRSWIEAAEKLEEAYKAREMYQFWSWSYKHCNRGSWDRFLHHWYQRQYKASEVVVAKLEAELLRIRMKNYRLSGSAFVLFRHKSDVEHLLGKTPPWYDFRRWLCWLNTLKFGHVPFTSVTLEYEPAPHPDDIEWRNMDYARWRSETVSVISTVGLVLFMTAGQVIFMQVASLFRIEKQVSKHYASLLLLFVNRNVLPFPVEWICVACRFKRRTEIELRQMILNFGILVVNTMVVPVLHIQIAQDIPVALKTDPLSLLWCLSFKMLKLPKRLFLGYLFDVIFITNAYQICVGPIFDLVGWVLSQLTATLPPPSASMKKHWMEERKEEEEMRLKKEAEEKRKKKEQGKPPPALQASRPAAVTQPSDDRSLEETLAGPFAANSTSTSRALASSPSTGRVPALETTTAPPTAPGATTATVPKKEQEEKKMKQQEPPMSAPPPAEAKEKEQEPSPRPNEPASQQPSMSAPPPTESTSRQVRRTEQQMDAPQYPFGYYYAWTLSIVALTLLSSGEVPITLLLTAICFFLKIAVDWRNLANGVYNIGPEHEGVLVTWVVFFMRLIVSSWWLLTGLGIWQFDKGYPGDCPSWVSFHWKLLLPLAIIVAVLSCHRIIHVTLQRRFSAGRLPEVSNSRRDLDGGSSGHTDPKLAWDAKPDIHQQEAPDKPRQAFRCVEQVVTELEERPSLVDAVQQFLGKGVPVPHILQMLQKEQHTRAASFSGRLGGALSA